VIDPEDVVLGGFLGLILSLFVGGKLWPNKKPTDTMDTIDTAVEEHVAQLAK
jgi:hypothetical protein